MAIEFHLTLHGSMSTLPRTRKRLWLLEELHSEAEQMLSAANTSYPHKSGRGDLREQLLREFLDRRLPQSVAATKGHIVDSDGRITPEFDIVLFNPLARLVISQADDSRKVLPVESVYCVVEVRTNLNTSAVKDAANKMKSLGELRRHYRPSAVAEFLDIDTSDLATGISSTGPSFVLPINRYLFGYDGISRDNLISQLANFPDTFDGAANLKGYIVFHNSEPDKDLNLSPVAVLSFFLLSVVAHLTDAAASSAFEVPDLERYWDIPDDFAEHK